MVIRYGKTIWFHAVVWLILCAHLLLSCRTWVQFLCFFLVILCISFLLFTIHFRTFCFSKEGISISLLNYSRFYRWDEMNTKRVEQYKTRKRKKPYSGSAYFCKRKTVKSPLGGANYYPWNCFSYIYVMFPKEGEITYIDRWFSIEYSADKKEFLEKLSMWGIQLDGNN